MKAKLLDALAGNGIGYRQGFRLRPGIIDALGKLIPLYKVDMDRT